MDPLQLCKYLENRADEAEMREVIEWLDADPAHRRELDELDRALWASALSGRLTERPAAAERPAAKRPAGLWRRIGRHAMRLAAVLALGFAGAELISAYRVGELSRRTTTLEVPVGRHLNMTLADGTTVWLNAGTKLEYPAVFAGKERRVKVSGEAMFDVAHDARHPFVVETFACDVEVLGTKFDVVADEAESRFSASLLRGSVKVTSRLDPSEQYVLRPDESVHLVGGHLSRRILEDKEDFLWTDGIISIKGHDFGQLMERFERSFGVKIVVERERMPQIDYNHGKIRISDGVDSALRLLHMASDFTYVKDSENDVITIR